MPIFSSTRTDARVLRHHIGKHPREARGEPRLDARAGRLRRHAAVPVAPRNVVGDLDVGADPFDRDQPAERDGLARLPLDDGPQAG